MKDEDLEPFAVADGLLAKMEEQPPAGQVTDTERQWMLDQARVLNVSVEVAGRELHAAAAQGHLTEQYSATLAMVSLKGRILYVISRVGLRGAAHPERN